MLTDIWLLALPDSGWHGRQPLPQHGHLIRMRQRVGDRPAGHPALRQPVQAAQEARHADVEHANTIKDDACQPQYTRIMDAPPHNLEERQSSCQDAVMKPQDDTASGSCWQAFLPDTGAGLQAYASHLPAHGLHREQTRPEQRAQARAARGGPQARSCAGSVSRKRHGSSLQCRREFSWCITCAAGLASGYIYTGHSRRSSPMFLQGDALFGLGLSRSSRGSALGHRRGFETKLECRVWCFQCECGLMRASMTATEAPVQAVLTHAWHKRHELTWFGRCLCAIERTW